MGAFTDFDDYLELPPAERRMLEALLLPAPRDAECFAQWLAHADLAAASPAARRLLPALLEKFRPPQAPGSRGRELCEAARPMIERTRAVREDGRLALEALAAAGITPVLFKGIAMALRYFPPGDGRSMGDFDGLVRREELARAEAALRPLGWRYAYPERKRAADTHGHDFHNARSSGFDLHWHLLPESARAGIDEGARERAQALDWDGLAVRVLSPEDLMLVTLVHGVRARVPLRVYWIHDVARIVRGVARPLDWALVWQEARERGLRARVFDALCLVHSVSEAVIPGSLLHALVEADPEFERELAAAAIAEGRTHGLSAVPPGAVEAPGAARHVRCFEGREGSIERLYLQAHHVPRLGDLFDVAPTPGAAALATRGPRTGAGFLDLLPGELAWRAHPRLRSYAARITLAEGIAPLSLAPGEVRRVALHVENTSPCCWPVEAGSPRLFAVTYHLLAGDGRVLAYEQPRAHLAIARRGYVAFFEPGQKIACMLDVFAPEAPGRYLAQLDFVHEHAAWFSAEGCSFPAIALEVHAPGSDRSDTRTATSSDRV